MAYPVIPQPFPGAHHKPARAEPRQRKGIHPFRPGAGILQFAEGLFQALCWGLHLVVTLDPYSLPILQRGKLTRQRGKVASQ